MNNQSLENHEAYSWNVCKNKKSFSIALTIFKQPQKLKNIGVFINLFIVLLFSLHVNAQITPTLLAQQTYTANGLGVSGVPTVNFNVPAGSNRLMVITTFIERRHNPLNSNWASSPDGVIPGGPTNGINILVDNIPATSRRVSNAIWFDNSNDNTALSAHSRTSFISDEMGLNTGTVSITFTNINLPENTGDEMSVVVTVFENAAQDLVYIESVGNNTVSGTSNFISISGTAATPPVGTSSSNIVYLGVGRITQQAAMTFSSGWTTNATLSSIVTNNNNGPSFPPVYNQNTNENDGISQRVAFRTYTSGNPSFSLSKSVGQTILLARAEMFAILPIARPSISGTVYRDNNGLTGGVNGGGTGGGVYTSGGLFVNALNADGTTVVASTSVNSSGVFTFPAGSNLLANTDYILQLSTVQGIAGQPTPNKVLPTGFATVGESDTSGPSDGNPDGLLNINFDDAGTPNSTTYRFGITTCPAGSVAPLVHTPIYIPCFQTSTNLNNAHAGTLPSGTSLAWFTTNTPTGSPLTPSEIATAGIGTYYLFYYSASLDCYSPASEQVSVVASSSIDSDGDGKADICDLDDDNDGILDTDECPPAITFSTLTPLPASAFISGGGVVPNGSFGARYTDPSGQKVIDIYQGSNSSPNNVQIPLINYNFKRFYTGGGGLGIPLIAENNNILELVWTTKNSPTPFDLKEMSFVNIGSFSATSATNPQHIRDAYAWSEPGIWQTNINNTANTNLAIVSVDGAAADKVGNFILEDVDVGGPNQISGIGNFLDAYDINPNIPTVLVNMLGSINGHSFKYTLNNPTDEISFYLWNTADDGQNLEMYFDFYLPTLIHVNQDCDADGDGIPNILDLDSDNDGCPDAVEYYASLNVIGTDGNNYFGNGNPPATNPDGTVIGASYTGNYSNVITATQLSIDTEPEDVSAINGNTAVFTVDAKAINTTIFNSGTPNYTIPPASDASTGLLYQWQESTDDGLTWNNISNGGQYSGANSVELTISNVTVANDDYQYRVSITHLQHVCPILSNAAILAVLVCPNAAGTDGSTTVCSSDMTPINLADLITGEDAGGVWTRLTGTGGTFNAAAGTFTPTVGATNSTFQYLVTGTAPCPNDASVATINITPQANAGADGILHLCSNDSFILDLEDVITGEQTGGTWTRLTGTGGTFDPINGTIFITGVMSDTSIFQYVVTGVAPCANDTSLAYLKIKQIPVTTQNLTICQGDSVCVFNPAITNRIINPQGKVCYKSTGIYYDTLYTAASTGCDSVVITNLTVVPQANAGTDGSTTVCSSDMTPINLADLITGEDAGGVWTRLTGTGGTFNAAAGTFTPTIDATNSTFQYLVTGTAPCPNDTSVATVNISNADAGPDKLICAPIGQDGSVTMSATGSGTWSFVPSPLGPGTIVNPTSPTTIIDDLRFRGTYTLIWDNGVCSDTVLITLANSYETIINANICQGDSLTVCDTSFFTSGIYTKTCILPSGCERVYYVNLTVSSPSTFTQDVAICQGDSIVVQAPNTSALRSLNPGEKSVYYTTGLYIDTLVGANVFNCDSIVITNLTVLPQANAGTDGSTTVCSSDMTPINLADLITGEDAGGVWTRLTGTGGVFDPSNGTFTPSIIATTSTFSYTVNGMAPCPNDMSVATVNVSPQVNAGTDGGTSICGGSSAVINLYDLITGEQSGGTWTRLTGTGGTFNATAGTFTPAAGATNSTFQYLVAGTAPCGDDTSIASVEFNSSTNAGTDGNTTVCDINNTTVDLFGLITGEQLGGTWTLLSGTGGTFDPVNGTFLADLGATTSSFQYTVTGVAPCTDDVSVATVNVSHYVFAGTDGEITICNSN